MIQGLSSNKPALVQIRRRSTGYPILAYRAAFSVPLGVRLRALAWFVMMSRLGRTAELEPLLARQAGGPSDELKPDHS
jgi:hypothetical protein